MSIVLLLFWIASGLFAGDVLLGKLSVLTDGAVRPFFGDVPHFLMLALAAALLTAESLRRETARKEKSAAAATPIATKITTK